MSLNFRRKLAPAVALAMLPVVAQAQQSPVCQRLDAQLVAFDRGLNDPARAERARQLEETFNRQQSDLERLSAQSRRQNCEGGFFVLFTGQSPQCSQLNSQISQMRASIDRTQEELAQARGGAGPEREAQRRAILTALVQNDCGAQYRAALGTAPSRGGFLESLFGPSAPLSGVLPGSGMPGEGAPAGTVRTLCVRTCDGYYYPISFATTPARFIEDARVCQQSCPATEVQLYSHPNPGGDINQATSINTQAPYTALPTAFKYRQAFDAACSCKRPGESWASALKEDTTIERGDIVVSDEQRARQLSQPRFDAQGRPLPQTPVRTNAPAGARPQAGAPPASTPNDPPVQEGSDKPDPKRKVRAVGPVFIPAR